VGTNIIKNLGVVTERNGGRVDHALFRASDGRSRIGRVKSHQVFYVRRDVQAALRVEGEVITAQTFREYLQLARLTVAPICAGKSPTGLN
jgi:hypothetical protein